MLMYLLQKMNPIKINSKFLREQSSENTKKLPCLNYNSNTMQNEFQMGSKSSKYPSCIYFAPAGLSKELLDLAHLNLMILL